MSIQPGRQETLDFAAAARTLQPSRYGFAFDHNESRNRLDLEPLEQVRPLLLRDQHDVERAVTRR